MTEFTSWGIKGAIFQEGLVASAGEEEGSDYPFNPPVEWFAPKQFDKAHPVRITEEGQIYGYVARWEDIHIGILGKDQKPPRSSCKYSRFRTGEVLTSEGSYIATGPIVVNTVHPNTRGINAKQAKMFYDNTGNAVADVAVYDDHLGIQIVGAVRPGTTQAQMRALRGSDFSPDWRSFSGQLEMVALLAVNTSGFVVDGLVASAGLAEAGIETESDYVVPGVFKIEYDIDNDTVTAMFGVHNNAKAGVDSKSSDEAIEALMERLDVLEMDLARVRLEELARPFDLSDEIVSETNEQDGSLEEEK